MYQNVFYVSPMGQDENSGSKDSPFRSMERARKEVRKYNQNMTGDIAVIFADGLYTENTICFDVKDSGTNGFSVRYQAEENAQPVFSGGVAVQHWEAKENGVFVAKLPKIIDMREFYVNGTRMPRASTKPIQGLGASEENDGIWLFTKDLPSNLQHPEDLQIKLAHNWRVYYLPIADAVSYGEKTKLVFQQPIVSAYKALEDFRYEAKEDTWLCVENDVALLTEAGQWYFDKREHLLYYKPCDGQDINTIEAVAPVLEQQIVIRGKEVETPVKNLVFSGFFFQYYGWTNPNKTGYCSKQATSRVMENDSEGEMLHGAISVDNAKNITFTENIFAHTAANAITATTGLDTLKICGNIFCDIGGSSVGVGTTAHGFSDSPEIPINISVNNNILRDCGMQYLGCPAITYIYTKDSEVCHNDIDGTSYTGISIGWGWSMDVKNQRNSFIGYNRIFNFNRKVIDGAAIYSLSRTGGSRYVGNYVKGVNAPYNTAALYHDEQSEGFEDYHNVVECERESYFFYNLNQVENVSIHDSYTNTANVLAYKTEGRNVELENIHIVRGEWPEEAREIIKASGLEPHFSHLYEKLLKIPQQPRVKKPLSHTYDSNFMETKIFEPWCVVADAEPFQAPFVEKDGVVAMDAVEYTDYVGLEKSNSAWMEFMDNHAWMRNYCAKSALLLRKSQLTRDESLYIEPATLGYDIVFETAGEYVVSIRGRDDAEETDGIEVFFDGESLGKIAFETETFSYQNQGSKGIMAFSVPAPGNYRLTIEGVKEEGVFLDRLWITQKGKEPKHKSVETGPYSNKRQGDFVYLDLPEKIKF